MLWKAHTSLYFSVAHRGVGTSEKLMRLNSMLLPVAASPFNCGYDVTVYYSPGSASGGGPRGSALVYNYDRTVPDQFQSIQKGVRVGYDCQVQFF